MKQYPLAARIIFYLMVFILITENGFLGWLNPEPKVLTVTHTKVVTVSEIDTVFSTFKADSAELVLIERYGQLYKDLKDEWRRKPGKTVVINKPVIEFPYKDYVSEYEDKFSRIEVGVLAKEQPKAVRIKNYPKPVTLRDTIYVNRYESRFKKVCNWTVKGLAVVGTVKIAEMTK